MQFSFSYTWYILSSNAIGSGHFSVLQTKNQYDIFWKSEFLVFDVLLKIYNVKNGLDETRENHWMENHFFKRQQFSLQC